jgi:hypothetical protein
MEVLNSTQGHGRSSFGNRLAHRLRMVGNALATCNSNQLPRKLRLKYKLTSPLDNHFPSQPLTTPGCQQNLLTTLTFVKVSNAPRSAVMSVVSCMSKTKAMCTTMQWQSGTLGTHHRIDSESDRWLYSYLRISFSVKRRDDGIGLHSAQLARFPDDQRLTGHT